MKSKKKTLSLQPLDKNNLISYIKERITTTGEQCITVEISRASNTTWSEITKITANAVTITSYMYGTVYDVYETKLELITQSQLEQIKINLK